MTTTPQRPCPACTRLGQINRDLSEALNRETARAEAAERDRDAYRAECARRGSGRLVPLGTLGPLPDGAHQHPPCTDGPARSPSNYHPTAHPNPAQPFTPVPTGNSSRAIAARRRAALLDFLSDGPQTRTACLATLGLRSAALASLTAVLARQGRITIEPIPGDGRRTQYRICR